MVASETTKIDGKELSLEDIMWYLHARIQKIYSGGPASDFRVGLALTGEGGG